MHIFTLSVHRIGCMCNKAKGRGTRLVSETAYAQTGSRQKMHGRKRGDVAGGDNKKRDPDDIRVSFVIPTGFKPVTFASVVRCSIQLSYGTVAISQLRMQRYALSA